MSRRTAWAAVSSASALAAVASVTVELGPPLQPLLVFWFVLVCPGMAVVGVFRIGSPLTELAAGVATSVACGVVVAQALLWAGLWSPLAGLLVLAVLTLLAASAPATTAASTDAVAVAGDEGR